MPEKHTHIARFLLPLELEPFRQRFEQHLLPVLKITMEGSEVAKLTDSKCGGHPYLPQGFDYPKDEHGKPMTLLAQLNFGEMPHLPDFPTQGIMQFYVTNSENNSYGVDWEQVNKTEPTPQTNFRVLYHAEVNPANARTDFSFLGDDDTLFDNTPLGSPISILKQTRLDGDWSYKGTYGLCLKLHFEKVKEPPLTLDYAFDIRMNQNPDQWDFWEQFGEKEEDLREAYNRMHPPFGHKVGGYAGFTQEDPRTFNRSGDYVKRMDHKNPWVTLLQIESDDHLQWGDCGVGHLFIRRQDLMNLDFSKIWYHWDCC